LVKGAFEQAGIPAIIQGDTAGGMRERLAWPGTGFKILVREDDATAARELFSSLSPADDEGVGEDSEIQQDSCPPWRPFS
jgi:hypothetical protein